MIVTRFPQSCLLIKKQGKQILIDPGDPVLDTHNMEELSDISAVFFTHMHVDHCSQKIATVLHNAGVPIYTNQQTVDHLGGLGSVVKDGDTAQVAGFKVSVYELPHSHMVDGQVGPTNTGFMLDDRFLIPGDTKEVQDLKAEVIAIPLVGPDISPRDAFTMARRVGAKLALAVHYDLWGADVDFYKRIAERFDQPFELRALVDGETTDL